MRIHLTFLKYIFLNPFNFFSFSHDAIINHLQGIINNVIFMVEIYWSKFLVVSTLKKDLMWKLPRWLLRKILIELLPGPLFRPIWFMLSICFLKAITSFHVTSNVPLELANIYMYVRDDSFPDDICEIVLPYKDNKWLWFDGNAFHSMAAEFILKKR